MGKRKRTKRPQGELEVELGDQLRLLRQACVAYDGGLEAIGKHIALSLRVLVHQRGQSRSLLEQLGYEGMRFFDSAGPLNPRNLLPEHNLVSIRVSGSGGRYVPTYNGPRSPRTVAFVRWWNDPVIKDMTGSKFSRRDLILNVADTDGGAHVDPELDEQYMALSRANSLGWEFRIGDIARSLDGKPELACMRQIAHELLLSIHTFIPKFSQAAEPPVPSDKTLAMSYPVT
jgi:hypothetical protein